MDLQKLNPWNWFKHEEHQIPVKLTSDKSNLPNIRQGASYPLLQLQQEIGRLFDGLQFPSSMFGRMPGFESELANDTFRPHLNISSDNKNYQITLEAPGMTESDLSIEVRGDMLTIQGQKQEEKENKDRHFYRMERSYGAFQRTLSLPEDANPDDIQASMKNGVLTLNIPRREGSEAEIKKITINQ